LSSLTDSLAVMAAVASVAAGVAGASPSPAPVHAAGCKHVKIQGHKACLAPGKYCTRQWESAYRRYGYTCSFLDRNDRYHLRRLPHR
jgi:hypothetical protein